MLTLSDTLRGRLGTGIKSNGAQPQPACIAMSMVNELVGPKAHRPSRRSAAPATIADVNGSHIGMNRTSIAAKVASHPSVLLLMVVNVEPKVGTTRVGVT